MSTLDRMKKIICLWLAAALLLAGCGRTALPESGQTAENENAAADTTPNGQPAGAADAALGGQFSDTAADAAPGGQLSDTAEEAAAEPPSVSLVMVGDILLHTPVAESGLTEDGSYDFHPLFAQTTSRISEADLALVNQEVILGGAELGVTGYPCFNAPYELGDALADAGFDVVLHATNHALDKGEKGLRNCLAFWQEHYPEIAVLGIHGSAEDQQEIYIYEQDGMRIAILNATYGTNGIPLPKDMPYGVDLLEQDRLREQLKEADREADFVIVCPHWGTEYLLETSAQQQKWTQFFLENGVDLVLGTHPHVIEPIRWEEDAEGHRMLVYYSLGNFLNWTSGTGPGVANRMVGGMAQITLVRDEQGEVVIGEYGVEPVVCHLAEGYGGVTVYPLCDYTEELADSSLIRGQDDSFSLEYCEELCRQVWGWQPAYE